MAKVRWLLFVVCTLIFVYGNTKGIAAQDNVRCDFDKNGTMTVSGKGVLYWSAIEESSEDEVGYGIKKVIIQEGITEISDGRF